MNARIYFDNAATTPLDPRVFAAMQPFLTAAHGNPSSLHREGREARLAVERARAQVAELLSARPDELIFTGSGTESDNLALRGVAETFGLKDTHLVISAIEHPAVYETGRRLAAQGTAVTLVPVDSEGLVDPAEVAAALRPDTRLVSVMMANNEVGTVQPLVEIAQVARSRGVLVHTDAVQAVGRLPLNLQTVPVDLLSLSAHKFYGPKGVGALFVREGVRLTPLIHGGGQEKGLRSATLNVAGIVGLGAAADIARAEMADEAVRLVALRERLVEGVAAVCPESCLLGHRHRRLPGHLCFGFKGMEGQAITLQLALDDLGVAVSAGSACSAHHAGEPSRVLTAMGFDPVRARGALRLSLGRFNTMDEVEQFLALLPSALQRLRPLVA